MKKLFIGIVLIIGLLLGAILILPGLVPASAYKDKIESQLAIALGRDVAITGDVKLSVFPVLKAQTGAVEIDNADGFSADHFITMDGLDARIRLLPLFSKRVEVAKFELTKPVVNLEKAADGSVNWALGNGQPKPETTAGEPFKRDGRFNDYNPNIGSFAITDGTITYRDAVADVSHDITAASLSFSLPSLDEIVEVDGALTLDGTPIDLDVSLDTPRYFLGGGVANFTAKLKTDFADIDAKGQFAESADIAFTANLDGNISDVDALIALVPQEVKYAELINESTFKGDFSYDGNDFTLSNGDISVAGDLFEADYKGDAKVNLAKPQQNAPVFAGRVSADVNNVPALAKILEQSIDGIDLVKTANIEADLSAKDDGFIARNLIANISGDTLNGTYEGQADIGDAITAQGDFTASVQQLPAVVRALKLELEQEVVIDTADVAGQLSYSEDAVDVTLSRADVSGDSLTAAYQGSVNMRGDAIKANGNFTASVQQLPAVVRALKLDLEQEVVIDTADVAGQVSYSADATSVTLSRADVSGETLTASYQGDVNLRGEAVTAKGRFTADAQQIPTLIAALKIDAAQAAILDRAKVSGAVDYSADAINLTLDEAQLNSPDLVTAYQGTVGVIGKAVTANGTVSQLDIPSLPRLSQKAGVDNKAVNMIGRVALTKPLIVSYDGNRAVLNNLDVALSGGALNGGYTGTLTQTLGDKPQTALKGDFKGDGTSLRALAKAYDVVLPASKPQGPVFENFAVNGTVEGDLNNMRIALNNLTIDQLSGTGQFTAALGAAKPRVTGTLNIPNLDVRPYQAAYAPPPNAPKPTGWSKEALNVSAIKNFDADVTLSTQQLLTSSVSFGQSDIKTVIKDSKLNVDFPNMALYGGQGRMTMSVNAQRRDPVLDMDISLASLDTESVLAKFVTFAQASGVGATNFKVRGAGLSMDSIMRSLSGGGEFGVRDGQVRGIDMATTLSGFSQGLSLQSAVTGLGADKVTSFRDLVGQFSMSNGVMTINSFNFDALGVAAVGGGQIDLGNQNIDFRFKPRLTTADANGFAKAGIPLRISGGFSNVKTGLDQDAVGSLLAAQAQNLIREQVGGQIGGSAGAILGSVLGGTQPATGAQPGQTAQPSTPDVGSVLGSILGSSQTPPSQRSQTPTATPNGAAQPQAPKKEEVQPEDVARDLIGGLFGSKKKKKKDDE